MLTLFFCLFLFLYFIFTSIMTASVRTQFRLYMALLLGFVFGIHTLHTALNAQVITLAPQTVNIPTTLQMIHNSPDPALSPIDISLGGMLSNIGQSFAPVQTGARFRTSTPPLLSIGGNTVDSMFSKPLAVRLSSQMSRLSAQDNAGIPFAVGKGANVVILSGVQNPRRFVSNPNSIPTDKRFAQFIDTTTITTSATVRLLVYHGVTDAPQLDVIVRGVGRIARLSYGEGMFVDVPTADYEIEMRGSTTTTLYGLYNMPLQTLNLGGQRATLMSSGFLATRLSNNRRVQAQYGSPFAAILVPSDSLSQAIRLFSPTPPPPPPTTLQLIHNSPDPSFNRMSIWAGTAVTSGSIRFIPFIQQFTYRNATQSTNAFITTIPTGGGGPGGGPITVIREEINFGSVLGTVLAINPALNNIRPGQTLNFTRFPGASITRGSSIILAHGVSTPNTFAQNPDTTLDRLLRLSTFTDPFDEVDTNLVRVLLFHGVTDAPRADFIIRETGDTLATLKYGQGQYVTLNPELYTLDVLVSDGEEALGSFVLPLGEHIGQRITVMTSGFLNSAANRNGSPFAGVLVSPRPGRQPDVLRALPAPTLLAPTTLQLIHNSPDLSLSPVRVWLGRPTNNNNIPPFNPMNPNAPAAPETVTNFSILESPLRYRNGNLAQSGFGDFIPFYKDVISVPLSLVLTTTASRTVTTALYRTPFIIGRGANILISSGVQRTRSYAANPDGIPTATQIRQFIDTYRLTTTDVVRLFAYNGLTDAPQLEFVARGNFPMQSTVANVSTVGTTTITTISTITVYTASTVSLGRYRFGEGGFTTLPTGDYAIDVRVAASQSTVASYSATLATMQLGGQRITLTPSGFWNYSAQNQTGNPWQMLAVVNTLEALTSTINTVTVATTTTGTLVTLITTSTIPMPHSFLLPVLQLPKSGSSAAFSDDGSAEAFAGNETAYQVELTQNAESTLLRSYPNPANNETAVRYILPTSSEVRISLYDARGQRITEFAPAQQAAGEHLLRLDVSALPQGAYHLVLSHGKGVSRVLVQVVR